MRTAVLILGTSVAVFLPVFSARTASVLEEALLRRATASPILVGRKGDPFDLTLAALYFRGSVHDPIPYGTRERLAHSGRAVAINVGHTASGTPVVGTELGYFAARGLQVVDGRRFAVLGEVVAGSEAAAAFRLAAGDRIRTDASNLYDLSGGYPYVLEVVGVLAPSDSPDDSAFFVDVKTTWMLDGALHGHTDVTAEQAVDPDREEDGNLEASAAIFLTQEVTDETRGTFHLHGAADALPVSGFVVFPHDTRRHDQLLGDLALDAELAAVRPVEVVRTVLEIVLRLQDGLRAAFLLVAVATVGFFVLVLSLTLQLRADELTLLRRMGSSRTAVLWIVGTEVALVAATATVIGASAAWLGAAQVALAVY
ncbi:MAG: putative ABC transport system permease protein [Myxococcota bacterium]|jgi:putative ABC transport system permease protein